MQTKHRIIKRLGIGEFGVVTLGLLSRAQGDIEVAVKTLNADASNKDKLRFLQEATIMSQFDHQNVIKLHGIVKETPMMIISEFMSHGDLLDLLNLIQPS